MLACCAGLVCRLAVLACSSWALLAGAQWRLAFAVFAATACVMAVVVAFTVPGPARAEARATEGAGLRHRLPVRLIVAAWLMGASSAALWSFGSELVALRLGWDGGVGFVVIIVVYARLTCLDGWVGPLFST